MNNSNKTLTQHILSNNVPNSSGYYVATVRDYLLERRTYTLVYRPRERVWSIQIKEHGVMIATPKRVKKCAVNKLNVIFDDKTFGALSNTVPTLNSKNCEVA